MLHILALALSALTICFAFPYFFYLGPYRPLGRYVSILSLVIIVTVTGFVIFSYFLTENRFKSFKETKVDLIVLSVLELIFILGFIFHAFYVRPLANIFEIDRFRLITVSDIPQSLADRNKNLVDKYSLKGPKLLSLRPFKDAAESAAATVVALQGIPLGARPDLWQSYEQGSADVRRQMKPVALLMERFPQTALPMIAKAMGKQDFNQTDFSFVPMIYSGNFYTAILRNSDIAVVTVIDLDSF